MSCSSISSDSGCRSVLLASKQRQRASRKSQNGSLGSCPCAARTAASRNVVLKTSCALRESPSIKKKKQKSLGKFCFRSDTLSSFVFAKFSALYAATSHRQEAIRLSCRSAAPALSRKRLQLLQPARYFLCVLPAVEC